MPIDKYLEKLEGIRIFSKIKLPNSISLDTESYILLPETKEHPDILVSQTRFVYTENIESFVRSLEINPQNNDNRDSLYKNGYLGISNYDQAIDINTALGGFTLPLNLFVEFVNKLMSGNTLDENNNPVAQRRIEAILEDLLNVRSPARMEWLNGRYNIKVKRINNQLIYSGKIKYLKFDPTSRLTEVEEPIEEDALIQEKRISLNNWLRNSTKQGLPKKDVASGEFYYWPSTKYLDIAYFRVDSLGTGLFFYTSS